MNLLFSDQKFSSFYSRWRKLWKPEIIMWARCSPELIFSKPFQKKNRRFGLYRCSECGNKWSSAYTWLIPGKGLLRQKCKNECKNLKAYSIVSRWTTNIRKFVCKNKWRISNGRALCLDTDAVLADRVVRIKNALYGW